MICFQLPPPPPPKKNIYNNLEPSPLDRLKKKLTPYKHIKFTLPIYFQPSLSKKNITTLPPPPKKKYQDMKELNYTQKKSLHPPKNNDIYK